MSRNSPAPGGKGDRQRLRIAVQLKQVRLLYANTPLAVVVTFIASFVLAMLQWNVIPHPLVVAWLVYMTVISLARLANRLLYHAKISEQNAAHASAAFLIGTALSAAGWGSAGILLFPRADLVHQVFLTFVLGGMMVGAASVLAAKVEGFATFILLTGTPVSLRMFAQGDAVHTSMGLLAGLYTVATLITAWRVHGTVLSSLQLQFVNKDLLESLECAKDRSEALSQKLLTARDDECRRVSRELHDSLNHNIAILSIDAELLKRQFHSTQDVPVQLHALRSHITALADDLRRIVHQLHPAVLERLGLVPALQSLCADISNRDDLSVQFRQIQVPEPIPSDLALCIYRVVQEGLQNVVKHSHSRRAAVVLAGASDSIALSIRDFGIGLSPDMVNKTGLGLLSIEERVRLLAGRVSIESRAHWGTRIVVRIPLSVGAAVGCAAAQ
jgi:signal transduction histidine kinase